MFGFGGVYRWLTSVILTVATLADSGCAELECNTPGHCQQLNSSHWCQNGHGIGCDIGNGSDLIRCRVGIACQNQGPTAASVPTNLTIVASPSSTSKLRVDLRIQWLDTLHNDASVTGYEVKVMEGTDKYGFLCACIHGRDTKHITLRDVKVKFRNSIRVLVRSLPTASHTTGTSLTIPLSNVSTENKCLAFATTSNQENCSASHNISSTSHMTYFPYTLIGAGDVTVRSEYLTDGNEDLMSAHISWDGLAEHKLGVMVELHDSSQLHSTSCTRPGRHPPCFIVTNASGVSIQPLNASINYTVNMYRFDWSICPSLSPTHLLDGCGSTCCTQSIALFPPKYSTTTTTTTSSAATSSSTSSAATSTSTAATSTSTSTSTFSISTSIQPAATLLAKPSSSSGQQSDYLVPIISTIAVGVVIVGSVGVLAYLIKNKHDHHKFRKKGFIGSSMTPGKYIPGRPLLSSTPSPHQDGNENRSLAQSYSDGAPGRYQAMPGRPLLNSTLSPCQDNKRSLAQLYSTQHGISQSSTQKPTAASHEYSVYFPQQNISSSQSRRPSSASSQRNSPPRRLISTSLQSHRLSVNSSQHSSSSSSSCRCIPPLQLQDNLGSILVLYSPSISIEKKELILKHLGSELTGYGWSVRCPDTECVKNLCSWMEQEVTNAKSVLCVCNEDFNREWEQCPLRHIIYGLLKKGEGLEKFITILLDKADDKYIPSLYLRGTPQKFLVTQVKEIARHIKKIPSYTFTPIHTDSAMS